MKDEKNLSEVVKMKILLKSCRVKAENRIWFLSASIFSRLYQTVFACVERCSKVSESTRGDTKQLEIQTRTVC